VISLVIQKDGLKVGKPRRRDDLVKDRDDASIEHLALAGTKCGLKAAR
jgi:hypothetical protein